MSNTSSRRAQRTHDHRVHWSIGIATVLVIGGLVVTALSLGGKDNAGTTAVASKATNAMGMPILDKTPGAPEGVAVGESVSATPERWALGRVPLNVAVLPRWEITNTGTDSITLGQPHVQINQGCCPGQLTFDGSNSLTPSDTVGLTFELSMHPGMDGAHDMTIHVPVTHADGTQTTLALSVTGDFRD